MLSPTPHQKIHLLRLASKRLDEDATKGKLTSKMYWELECLLKDEFLGLHIPDSPHMEC